MPGYSGYLDIAEQITRETNFLTVLDQIWYCCISDGFTGGDYFLCPHIVLHICTGSPCRSVSLNLHKDPSQV